MERRLYAGDRHCILTEFTVGYFSCHPFQQRTHSYPPQTNNAKRPRRASASTHPVLRYNGSAHVPVKTGTHRNSRSPRSYSLPGLPAERPIRFTCVFFVISF